MKITKEQWHFAAQISLKIFAALYTSISFVCRAIFVGLTPKKTEYEGTLNTPDSILGVFNKGFAYGSYKSTRHDSCHHSLVIGGSGAGKSVTVMFPTIYNMTDASLVLHNPSGELLQTAGYLTRQGYEIKILHFDNPEVSDGYNPLARENIQGSGIQKLCTMLVRTALGDGGKDPFWSTQATMFLTLLCKLVKTQSSEFQNFTNVKFLLEQYQINSEAVDRLVAKAGIKYEEILNEYKVFLKYESKVMANIVSTCRSALSLWSTPSVQKVTSVDTIDFEEFRTKKIALFIETKTSNMHYYGVLTSMFAQQFFNHIMNQPPNQKKQRHIYFLLDEASSIYLPTTMQIALSNLRKFNCGIMLLIQDYNQLKHLYGTHEAEAIKTNCHTKVYFPNQDIETCRELETFLGKREYEDKEGKRHTRSVLTADEIKAMPKGHVLLFAGSHRAIYTRLTPYFKNLRYWLYSRIPIPEISRKLPLGDVPRIPLPKVAKSAKAKPKTDESEE